MTANRDIAVRVWANPDTNTGEPQRGWLIYAADGQYRGFVNEGHSGRRALLQVAAEAASLLEIPEHFIEVGNVQITQAQFKRLLKSQAGEDEIPSPDAGPRSVSSLSSPFGAR